MRSTSTPLRRVLVVLLVVVRMLVPGGKRDGAGLPAARGTRTATPKGRDAP
ncbi:hypothetical protein [Streptomyces luteogriseus]|uniref:hypothetical protein n=1 Tax=Streptomyces luteogriseus TaxID=68233 RepID=UPI0037FAE589